MPGGSAARRSRRACARSSSPDLRAPRRIRLALAVALAAAAAAIAIALLVDRGSSPPEFERGERSAAAFVDSIGVVTHLPYLGTAYERRTDVLARLLELGVHHIRDAAPTPTGPLADGLREARAQGIYGTLGSGDPTADPARWVADSLAVMGDHVAAFEAPNELDNNDDPDWPAKLRAYMPRLAAAVRDRAPGTDVIGPSFVDPTSRTQVPRDLPGMFNAHPYSGGLMPEPTLDQAIDEWHAWTRRGKAVFTETGYHNALSATLGQPPASEQAAAVYIPRVLLTAFGAGVRRTFIYELVDVRPDPSMSDAVQHWGLLRNDFSPKPAFTAVKTLIAAVKSSPGPSADARLRWSLETDGDERVERVVLARRDGSRVIALWRPVSVWDRDARQPVDPGQVSAELSFGGRAARDVWVWRPSISPLPVVQRARARRIPLQLQGDVVLVSVR
jgi:hypothetical protein